jgi:hypothetical protein
MLLLVFLFHLALSLQVLDQMSVLLVLLRLALILRDLHTSLLV